MKFSFTVLFAPILVFALGIDVQAAIEGSDHDLTGSGSKICETCHVPHNALGAKLWSSSPSGIFSGVADLCFTCHDGSITDLGITTAFDQTKDQHIMVGTDCSGSDGCHDVHNQNPNTTGRFLVPGVIRTNNSYCETCHDETPFAGAEALGIHNAANSHYSDGSTFICESCHSVHGAVMQTVNPPGLTHPILLSDNNGGDFYGEFCVSCHNGIPPPSAVPGTGGVAASDVYDYSESVNDGTQSKHPTNTTSGPYPINGCEACHVPHSSDVPVSELYDLRMDNTNSAYCVNCHTSPGAPQIGEYTHFSQAAPSDPGMNDGLTTPLPWANEIDEDGNPGQDWLSATPNMMTCETCHSVHRQGFVGSGAGHLLRYPSDGANTFCQACHTDY